MIKDEDQSMYEQETAAYQRLLARNPDSVKTICFNCGVSGTKEEFAFVQIYNVMNEHTRTIKPENDYYYCQKCFYWIRDSLLHGGVLFGYKYSHVKKEKEEVNDD